MKKNPDAITVLVADDHPVVREGIATMVNQQRDMTVVAEAATGEEAIAAWRKHHPDVSLVDLQLPGLSGADVVQAIRRDNAQACALILSTYDLEEDIFRCVQAGARGYLLKDTPRLELLDAIRRVHQGEKVLTGVIASKLADRVSNEAPTPRELEVLAHVALGQANKEIGDALNISEGTVKAHVKSLFAKLGVMNRTEAVKVAHQRGLLRGA